MEAVIVKIYTSKLGISRKEMIQYIRSRPGKVVCLRREPLGLPHWGVADDTFEKASAVNYSSGKYYRMITDLRVTTVSLANDNLSRVGGSAADKVTS